MKSAIKNRQSQIGFTLVELLVVITIIVVLLALLTPALDKAIYQAELAVCATHQKSIATGAFSYATTFRRWHPYRPLANLATEIHATAAKATAGLDDRPKIMPFIPLAALLDPLCGKIDISIEGNDADASVNSNYDLFFGYKLSAGGANMIRLGDRFVWLGDTFNVLTKDHDRSDGPGGDARSSHPDTAGTLFLNIFQNRWGIPVAAGQGTSGKWTLSFWDGPLQRPAVDFNVAFDDNSVIRYNNVAYNQWATEPARWSRVPTTQQRNYTTDFGQVPVQGR